MAGITQKSCVALFPFWSLKKKTFFGGGAGGGGENRYESTETYEKIRVMRYACINNLSFFNISNII